MGLESLVGGTGCGKRRRKARRAPDAVTEKPWLCAKLLLRCTVYTDAVTEKWLCAKQLLRGTVYSSGTQRIQWNIWYTENSIEYLVHREID